MAEAWGCSDGKPYYCKATGVTPSGKALEHEFKAARFDDGFTVWELRRYVEGVGYVFNTNVKYFRKEKIALLEELLISMTCKFDEPPVIPSRRFFGKQTPPPDVFKYVQDEFTMPMKHFVAMLLITERLGHQSVKMDNAQGLRSMFVSSALPADIEAAVPTLRHPMMLPHLQCDGVGGDQVCRHLRAIHYALARADAMDLAPQLKFAYFFRDVLSREIACPHFGAWFKGVVEEVSAIVEINLENYGHSNPLKTWRPEFAKRRRMDEHMKDSAVQTVKKTGLAPNVSSWARATQQANPKSMAYVRDMHLSAYHAATLRDMEGATTYKLVFDGARLGEPKQEYMFALGENCDNHIAAWSPPTVRNSIRNA
jgi:hypothetical protein